MDEQLTAPVVGLLVAFFAALAAAPALLKRLRILKFGQNINTYAPEGHQAKQGTPTMGGLLFVVGAFAGLIGACAAGRERPGSILFALGFLFITHVGIGFLDDYLSIKRGKSLGLKAREKLFLQLVVSVVFVAWLSVSSGGRLLTAVGISNQIDLGWAFYPVAVLLIMGMSNATNLTDGLDGLAGGLAIPATIGLSLAVLKASPLGTDQIAWFGFALAGSCLGFLWYNAHPARVFMGDTGSLAIGASLAGMAIAGRRELLMLVLSLVYLAELGSVMIQVPYFKLTHGKRVFKKTPLHHHFEELGWAETHVVARFWIVGGLSFAVGMACLRWL